MLPSPLDCFWTSGGVGEAAVTWRRQPWHLVAEAVGGWRSGLRRLGSSFLGEGAIGARGTTKQPRQARDVVRAGDGAVHLVSGEHQTQVEHVPGGQHGLQPQLHSVEIIAAVAYGAAESFVPDGGDCLAGQAIRADQRIRLTAERCRGLLLPDQLDLGAP